MANVHAQEVFSEIVRNEVPLEEWPTYIFTRVYAQRSATYDAEIAALKAVAKRTNPTARAGDGGGGGGAVPRSPAVGGGGKGTPAATPAHIEPAVIIN